MKHQYFGDINDYRKYGLLRILSGKEKIRTAICWMLTNNDGRSDGKHTSYLNKHTEYRKYDPELFDKLHECVHVKNKRHIELAEQMELIPGALYHSKMLTDNVSERQKYFEELTVVTKDCDLVFFDQDNGMEVGSVKYGTKDSSKYLYWHELIQVYKAGHSVLAYQHFPRKPHDGFREEMFRQFCERLDVKDAFMFITSNVLFILIPQEKHRSYFYQCALMVHQVWGDEIKHAVMKLDKKFILEAVPGGEMTDDQVETVARTLARWIQRDLASKGEQ